MIDLLSWMLFAVIVYGLTALVLYTLEQNIRVERLKNRLLEYTEHRYTAHRKRKHRYRNRES